MIENKQMSSETVESLYRLETELKGQREILTQSLGFMEKRFEQVDKRFEQVDRRFEQMEKRFEQVDKRFEQVDKRFEQIDKAVRTSRQTVRRNAPLYGQAV
jgi:prefoldin subunit 5